MNAKRRHRRRHRREKARANAIARQGRKISWSDVELTVNGELVASGKATVRTSGVYTIECVMVISPRHHGAEP